MPRLSILVCALLGGAECLRLAALGRRAAFAAFAAAATAPHAAFASKCDTIFAGTYTDPINHPGGTRKIFLNADLGPGGRNTLGPFQLAAVKGGGGRGEPESYRLEALVEGDDKAIIIDFTPKGGPDNFKGVYEKKQDGAEGIRFLKDKNFWPKVGGCE